MNQKNLYKQYHSKEQFDKAAKFKFIFWSKMGQTNAINNQERGEQSHNKIQEEVIYII